MRPSFRYFYNKAKHIRSFRFSHLFSFFFNSLPNSWLEHDRSREVKHASPLFIKKRRRRSFLFFYFFLFHSTGVELLVRGVGRLFLFVFLAFGSAYIYPHGYIDAALWRREI